MAAKTLTDLKPRYDVAVIGGGLGGMTAANRLAQLGHSVLLLEQHTMLGGLATWFRRGEYIFDVALHGFPIGMKKTCRKYWNKEIAHCVVQLKNIRFDNPQFSLTTTFDEDDFRRILGEHFRITPGAIDAFFGEVRNMNFYDDQRATTRELFEKYFPGRSDVVRFLMEPIAYANGSTLEDPAITYGIVFSNFMSKGVYTFAGGTDKLLAMMEKALKHNGVDVRTRALVERIVVKDGVARGVIVNGRQVECGAVLSNANLLTTIRAMAGAEHFSTDYFEQASRVRVNNSSCQVYIGIKEGQRIDDIGDLIFASVAPEFDAAAMRSRHITSRTFSVYYPATRPETPPRYTIVSSTNANYDDWAGMSKGEYKAAKEVLIEDTLDALGKYAPNARDKVGHAEAATPLTFERYTRHVGGASFGTKFEGLKVSMELKDQIKGLFHAGSAGIIMSGWLGAANYGAIVANDVDQYLSR